MAMTADDRMFIQALIEVIGVKVDANKSVTEAGLSAVKARLDTLNGTVAKNCTDIIGLKQTMVGMPRYEHDKDISRTNGQRQRDEFQRWVAPIVSGVSVVLILKVMGMLKP
jgi:hypothetical protein